MQHKDRRLCIFTIQLIKTMKNLLLIFALFICFNSFSQTDTTVFFEYETVSKYSPELLFESEWNTIDSVLFDISQDSTIWVTSRWKRKDSVYVNVNRYKIFEFQKRINAQGIKQRKHRRIRYQKNTFIKRTIR